MSKYDSMMKCAKARNLVNENKYEEAFREIDEVPLDQVKVIADLNLIADIFIKRDMYDRALEVYQYLYERVQTRRILYQLIFLSVKCGQIAEAEDYYKEYISLPAQSSDRLILKYFLDKGRGLGRKQLIADLEELKREDYIEEWAYELAKLYHKEGMEKECIEECSDIVMWFGEGKIVEKAMLLKLHYVDGLDISSPKAIEETRNLAADLKVAAAIAAANDRKRADLYEKDEEDALDKEVEEAGWEEEQQAQEAYSQNWQPEEEVQETYSQNWQPEEEVQEAYSQDWQPKEEVQETYSQDWQPAAGEQENRQEHSIWNQNIEDQSITSQSVPEQVNLEASSNKREKMLELLEEAAAHGRIPHFALIGEDEDKITEFAKNISKGLAAKEVTKAAKLARINSSRLNEINLTDKLPQLKGGCLLISEAGKLSINSLQSLNQMMRKRENGVVVILADKEDGLESVLRRNRKLQSMIEFEIRV